ncbi:DNA-directed RNA polymerase [Podospora fimiseda]|uniref:DNA-directed RNA polymerase n=1 Tax=Podospora fimiseda TaxID=252190 RepID=A0AAN7BQJ4_9PEZI|nr:DNA-directed RNA polymerase [Podospora fimiseda]
MPPPAKSHTDPNDDEDDPIINSFNVFIKPKLPKNKELLILQYHSMRSHNPSEIQSPYVLEMRVKPESGFYEVDVPIDTSQAYDKAKGMAWGDALHKSNEARKGGGHGLAAGFNLIPTSQSGSRGNRRGGAAGDNEPELNWAEQLRLDRVLRKRTLGGQKIKGLHTKDMVGVFQGQNLHLTPISSIVRMTTQLHHLDAATEQEKLNRPNPAGAAGAGGPGDKPGGRAIQMTIKSADNSDGAVSESIIDRMHAIQRESWRKMDWAHEDSDAAWDAYNKNILLHPGDGFDDDEDSKGKAVEGKSSDVDDSGAPDLVDKVPHLKTEWTEEDVLEAMRTKPPVSS